MSKYIDRKDALRILNDVLLETAPDSKEQIAVLKCSHSVRELPTANVAPVVHGSWVPFHSQAAGDIWYCSTCEIGFAARMRFCPNCGAKMDLEVTDNG